jgi:XTP/dITP diphosphohydrolase
MTQQVPLPDGERLLELVRIMDRLRSPGGCPWDAEQTHESLVEYLLEEAYEAVEAIESGDRRSLREELGDVLLQVVFHSRVAQEDSSDPFDIDDVAGAIVDKLVRRHPHVFADGHAPTAQHVEARWQELKAAEKKRDSVTDGVPLGMPALLLAMKLRGRALNGGGPTAQVPVAPEVARASAEQAVASVGADEIGYGSLLMAIAAQARHDGVDAEAALRDSVRRYRLALRQTEGLHED